MKLVLGVVGVEMAMDFGSKRWNRCLMRGPSSNNPRTDLGLLRTIWIACWTKIVRVNLLELDSMILLKMNGLKCVWKMIC